VSSFCCLCIRLCTDPHNLLGSRSLEAGDSTEWGSMPQAGGRCWHSISYEVIELLQFSRHFRPQSDLGVRSVSHGNESQITFSGGKARQARKADKSQPSVSQLSRRFGIPNISQTYRPPRPVTGIALIYVFFTYRVTFSVSISSY
jgi:hypothetical protein